MSVTKLWDNVNPSEFKLAEAAGKAGPHQFTGGPLDNLAELSGRICYSSVSETKGKPSEKYHKHIAEVKHDSIYGHCVLPFEIDLYDAEGFREIILLGLTSRPGVWITEVSKGYIRVVVSLRAVLQWYNAVSSGQGEWRHGPAILSDYYPPNEDGKDTYSNVNYAVYFGMYCAFHDLAKLTLAVRDKEYFIDTQDFGFHVLLDKPKYDQEHWMSFYIDEVSRDLLQELVRHHYQTAFSVRSTRYCDEAESNFITPPYLEQITSAVCNTELERAHGVALDSYRMVYENLVWQQVPLKTARGVARSILPGGTETKLVFSASVAQLKWLISMRNHESAEPEIRKLAAELQKYVGV